MKKILDRDLGIDCDFVSMGDTDVDVINKATNHIRDKHPEEYDRVKSMLSSSIKEDLIEEDEEFPTDDFEKMEEMEE